LGFHSWLYCPIIALPRIILRSLLLYESFVKAKIVTNTILPASLWEAVIGEGVRNPFVYLSQSQSMTGCTKNRHPYEGSVAIRWLSPVIRHQWHLLWLRDF